MAHRKLDSVQQIATGTGTGALTLGAATAANYRTMQAAGMTNADTGTFRIQHETILAEWEEVLVTYNAGAITRTFDTNAKSATGSLINFSAGNKIVSCVLRAGDAVAHDNNGDAHITRDLYVANAGIFTGNVAADALLAGDLEISGTGAFGTTLSVTGNVGIGIAAASADSRLHVAGGSAGVDDIYITVDVNGGDVGDAAGIVFQAIGTNKLGGIKSFVEGSYLSNMRFYTATVANTLTEALRITSGRHLHPGTAAVQDIGNNGTRWRDGYFTTNIVVGNVFLQGDGTHGYLRTTTGNLYFGPPGINAWYITATGNHFLPVVGSTYNIGSASLPINTGWTATAWTVTSSMEVKTLERKASAAERRAAARIKARGPSVYKVKTAVDTKGDAARWHIGYIAEWVRDDMLAEGLDPWAYGFLCSDPLFKSEVYFETLKRPKMRVVPDTESAVEIIDGKPVMVRKEIEREEPVGEFMLVLDEAGAPVMHKVGEEPTGAVVPVLDGEGRPMTRRVIVEEGGKPVIATAPAVRQVMRDVIEPLTHFVPEMEEYQVERTREVDTGELRLGLRYSELEAFLRSAD